MHHEGRVTSCTEHLEEARGKETVWPSGPRFKSYSDHKAGAVSV